MAWGSASEWCQSLLVPGPGQYRYSVLAANAPGLLVPALGRWCIIIVPRCQQEEPPADKQALTHLVPVVWVRSSPQQRPYRLLAAV